MAGYRKYFARAVMTYYPDSSTSIMGEIDQHYTLISPDIAFAATSKNPLDKRLDVTGYFLALIMTLDKRGEPFDNTRKICLEIVMDYVKPKNKLQVYLKRLPAKLANTWVAGKFIKVFNRRVSVNANRDGFIARIITDKKETFGLGYGFDIIECGICKLYRKYNYEKYVPILCEVDKITSEMAGLKLVRNGTIAMGARICDFRFKKEPS
jgi:L-2-amino-thiazoline-4-carboxylic acid hydrolase